MIPRATSVAVVEPYQLRLAFEDGASGTVDLRPLLYQRESGVFAELRDRSLFAQVWVDPELETVAWPNGADIDPYVLYARATGTPVR
jgi:hypothetical protein